MLPLESLHTFYRVVSIFSIINKNLIIKGKFFPLKREWKIKVMNNQPHVFID